MASMKSPPSICETLRTFVLDETSRVTRGDASRVSSDFDSNLYLAFRKSRPGFVSLLFNHEDDILVCGDPCANANIARLLTLRLGELKTRELGVWRHGNAACQLRPRDDPTL